MDFLDSLDLDVSYKRSRRVRSWYLYEQFKSLERNQIDAALKLKERSFQNQVLRQELSERRDRRTLYTRSRESHESVLSRSHRNVKSEGADSIYTGSIDDLLLDFSELYDSGFPASVVADDLSEQSCQENGAIEDDCKSLGDQEENTSGAQSMQSVVYVESDGTITGFKEQNCYEETRDNCDHISCEDNCEEQLPHDSQDTVVAEINYYFDELKDNLENIEKLAEFDYDSCDDQRIESDSVCSIEEELPVVINTSGVHASNKNIIAIWSKVVSFAHQVVQLNHGNCYSDYGSQILTAVLACDVLCRGISKICYILQPFVCPVRNCASSDSDCSDCFCYKREKRKIKRIPKRGKCRCLNKTFKRNSMVHITETYCSDNWQSSQNTTAANRTRPEKGRVLSEPYTIPSRSQKLFFKRNSKKSFDSSIFNKSSNGTSKDLFKRRPQCKMLSDIMKLSQYFDNILKDIEETMQVSNL